MAEIQLVAEPGRTEGSSESRRLRHAGKIPAVVYGHGIDPIPVAVDARDLRIALNGEAGSRALLELAIGNERHLAVARQLQRHPVRHTVTHVDFQVVRRDEVISAEIPIVIIGEALAVHRSDGTVGQEMQTLLVKARPASLPPSIEIDISDLEIGQAIRVGDLRLPDGVETDVDGEQPIVIGQGTQVSAADLGEGTEAESAADVGSGSGTASEGGGDSSGAS
jgi:large subunit ribosomal protein L25